MDDLLAPVMAPRLAGKRITSSHDLLGHTLIHDERAEDWSDWFAQAKVKTGSISAGLDFSDSDFALMAAELGHGVALASLPLAQPAIDDGRLVRPLKETLKTGHAWFAMSTAAELADPVTRDVWQWLMAQSADGAG